MPTLDGVKYAYTAEGIKAYIKALRKKGRRNTKGGKSLFAQQYKKQQGKA
jgi:hypothetical protein